MTLVLMANEIGPGDAVFVPDFTFFSSGEVVSFLGATPIFVDVDYDTFNMDVCKLEKLINKVIDEKKLKPKVIIPVDLFGLPANHIEIERIAKKYDLFVLEDAAQGFGGSINEKKACSFGNAATTSFFPAKPLGCYGDGGAIFTNDDNLADLIRSLKVHGKGSSKYDNIRIGVNSRLDTLQAAILKVKLHAIIEHEIDDVNRVYNMYNDLLSDVVQTPKIPDGYLSSFAQYTIKLHSKDQRDGLQSYLASNDVPSMIYYMKPMHSQDAFETIDYNGIDYSITNNLCDIVLSLPMHPYLSEKEIKKVSDLIKEYMNNDRG